MSLNSIIQSVGRKLSRTKNDSRIQLLNYEVLNKTIKTQQKPVLMFNASTRLDGISLNAGFSFLTGLSLRLRGIPVKHFVCQSGMKKCVLGTLFEGPDGSMPCKECLRQSKVLYPQSERILFQFKSDEELRNTIQNLPLENLEKFVHEDLPLGELVLPTMRWVLRRHHLFDDKATRELFRDYLCSAWNIAQQFEKTLVKEDPQCVLVFNGMFYPEATVKHISEKHGVRVASHEVGLAPFSGYFTYGEATAYPIDIPDEPLTFAQQKNLDGYLAKRFKGDFSMAGIRFWSDFQQLSDEFWEQARRFKQIVPVFTNVVFDTSQKHANVLFPQMFAWLDEILESIKTHPETLFVIRAHPDEDRPGKQSRESVSDWIKTNQVDELENVMFVDSKEYFSSYELIQKSKFVMIYNSTIGLEASIMGAPVLSGGKARFTQIPTVFFPASQAQFREQVEEFLNTSHIEIPGEFKVNAEKFLYYQVFRSSLPFTRYLDEDGFWKGYVKLKKFTIEDLLPENSETMQIIQDGLLDEKEMLLSS
ncbi:MAG: hypothetical protein JEZ06_01145 [Anaerolineaceae bacterium]|nr:hypothetical protein [Anaerolineaceae bacterium]